MGVDPPTGSGRVVDVTDAKTKHEGDDVTTAPVQPLSDAGSAEAVEPMSGALIKAAREALGLTQTELGARLTPPAGWRTVAHWEADDFKPKSPRREQLAAILGIPLPGFNGEAPPLIAPMGMDRPAIVKELLAIRDRIDKVLADL